VVRWLELENGNWWHDVYVIVEVSGVVS
jgi:hypothetical protein